MYTPLSPVYLEKCCPRKEGHPPSRRVNFSECFKKKMLTPLREPRTGSALVHVLIVSPVDPVDQAGEAKVSLYGEKLARLED